MLKIKPGYVLRTVANQHIVVPTGEASVRFNGVITLNDSGKMLFEALKKGATQADLITTLTNAYDVDEAEAKKDIDAFLKTLEQKDVLEQR